MKRVAQLLRATLTSATLCASVTGCAVKPIHDSDLLKLVDGNVVRMQIQWEEPEGKALMPPFYSVEGSYFKWTENANQYRWVISEAHLRRDKWGMGWRRVLVPDQIQRLRRGDWVDVYFGIYEETNYGELRAPVVLRFICKNADKECKKRSEKELGGKFEVVSSGRPADVAYLTFSKVHDLAGKALNLQPR